MKILNKLYSLRKNPLAIIGIIAGLIILYYVVRWLFFALIVVGVIYISLRVIGK